MTANQPLAARMRPTSLDEVVGQDHLIFPGSPRYWFSADKTTRSGYQVHFPAGWADMSRAQRAASYLGCDSSIFEGVTTKEEFTAAWQQLVDTGDAELAHSAISLYSLKDPRPSPICDRHGGALHVARADCVLGYICRPVVTSPVPPADLTKETR